MNNENLLYEQRILELEKKLLNCTEALAKCKNETSAFMHIAAHDLQAPLRKAVTFAERVIQKTEEGKTTEAIPYVEKMISAIASMQTLIDALSLYSGISTTDTTFIHCDLNGVLTASKKEMGLRIKENNIDINSGSLPVIEGDPEQLKEVFKQLLDNAIKFKNTSQQASLTFSSEILDDTEKNMLSLDPGKIYHKIIIADNGIGFSDEQADKILKPFHRLHGKSAYDGHGLGLAICKKIIDLHFGIIYARGTENSGARIVLILPEIHNI